MLLTFNDSGVTNCPILKYIFPLDFAEYLSYLEEQRNSKVDTTKKEVCSKSVIKTLYGSKFLVSKYIFKLVYHLKVAGDQRFVGQEISQKNL